MSNLNQQQHHARQLLSTALATIILTSFFAVTSYSGTRRRSFSAANTNGSTTHIIQPQTPALKANGKIAFVSDRDGNNEIYVMDADGGNQKQLTNNLPDTSNTEPAWSPDGAKIVFVSQRDDDSQIYVMNADGSNRTRLTNNSTFNTEPDWSPDGSMIVFNFSGFIAVMNADGSGQTAIRAGGFHPVWSPDGTKIAFACEGDVFSQDICVTNANGSDLKNLTKGQVLDFNYDPAWSPDGAKILFVHTGFCIFGPCTVPLFVMNEDGSNPQQLLSLPTIGNPGWSPDGTRITFDNAQSSGSTADIFVADSSGRGATNLSNHPARDFDPAWGPKTSMTPSGCPNPIDCTDFFVRQQYLDFLNREPDTAGFTDWLSVLNGCGPNQGGLGSDPYCDRVEVSSGFFRSTEFGERGYWLYRFFAASLGRGPQFAEFLPESQKLSGSLTASELAARKADFIARFMQLPEFTNIYAGITDASHASQFIAKLEEKARVTLPASATTEPDSRRNTAGNS